MGADLHAAAVDQQEYLDHPLNFMSLHGVPPSRDVTAIRDAGEVPGHLKDVLRMDRIEPAVALSLADGLERVRAENDLGGGLDLSVLGTVHWLRVWAGANDSGIRGIH